MTRDDEIPVIDDRTLRRTLAETANRHSALAVMVGWGDGRVVDALSTDPLIRRKRVLLLALPGDEAAVARFFVTANLPMPEGFEIHLVRDERDLVPVVANAFVRHDQIAALAGCEVIAGHPLPPIAEAFRGRHLAKLRTLLKDRCTFYGNDLRDSFDGLRNSARNAGVLLPAPTISELAGCFATTPVIAIGAGPSLGRSIDQLRALQHKCILVACDAVYPGLLAAGIDPHFVTPLERVAETTDLLRGAVGSRTIFAGLPVIPPEGVGFFTDRPGRAIGLYAADQLYRWLWPEVPALINTGFSTGVLSVTVASTLGTGDVYLVGHDLAHDEASSHWPGAATAGEFWARAQANHDAEVHALRGAFDGHERRLLPGHDGGQVESIAWWELFRETLSITAASLAKDGRRLINLNAHHRQYARIDHTVAAPLPDPAGLPDLPPIVLPPADPGRLHRWQERARELPADARRAQQHLRGLRERIARSRGDRPDRWPIAAFAAELSPGFAVSPGNQAAFNYVLRSALHNGNAEGHHWARARNHARAGWRMLDAMDRLASAMDAALDAFHPELEDLVHDCCQAG